MLLYNRANVNAANSRGLTALMFAVEQGNLEMVKLLLRDGANRRLKDGSNHKAINYTTNSDIKKVLSSYTYQGLFPLNCVNFL